MKTQIIRTGDILHISFKGKGAIRATANITIKEAEDLVAAIGQEIEDYHRGDAVEEEPKHVY